METPQELLAKAKQYAKSDSTDFFANTAKGTVNGALIGGVLGFLVGWKQDYNRYGSALVGIIAGGIVSNLLIKYKN